MTPFQKRVLVSLEKANYTPEGLTKALGLPTCGVSNIRKALTFLQENNLADQVDGVWFA